MMFQLQRPTSLKELWCFLTYVLWALIGALRREMMNDFRVEQGLRTDLIRDLGWTPGQRGCWDAEKQMADRMSPERRSTKMFVCMKNELLMRQKTFLFFIFSVKWVHVTNMTYFCTWRSNILSVRSVWPEPSIRQIAEPQTSPSTLSEDPEAWGDLKELKKKKSADKTTCQQQHRNFPDKLQLEQICSIYIKFMKF